MHWSCALLIRSFQFCRTIKFLQLQKRSVSVSSDMLKTWETDPRLPRDVIPLHYDLLLNPNLNHGIFSGRVRISVNILSPKNVIILHSVGLTIEKSELMSSVANEKIQIKDSFLYSKNEFFVILLDSVVQSGIYDLHLLFNGSLTNKIIGFYRSSYKDIITGETRFIATSKFEPTYARQAFPCFDEPDYKAEFSIKLVKPSGNNYIALSNMNQVEESVDQPEPGSTTIHFAKSVPMSTYLACFIVCDFDHLKPVNSKQGFPITVYARCGQEKNMRYALDLAAKTIDYYIDYFGINYPLPKLDLIAIPDFVSGAMEHWGLVTFRETSVLFNEGVTSSVNKKYVSYTVTHELAHMWFGNLVTMKWWNDLWLNEGFASFIETKGTHLSHPEWDVDTQQLTDDIHVVMALDSVLSSHPIIQTVSHPDQITEIFDTISYSKGATIIRMLEYMMGTEAFRKGISKYLSEFAYKNAETEDLWKFLENEADGINISQVMGTWTRQMGYPLVNVERTGNTVTVTQQRFLADSNAKFSEDESPFHYKWDVLLSYVTSVNPSEVSRCWFYHSQPSVTINLPSGTTWFKMNHREFGYYRVRYSSDDWQKLITMMLNNHENIHAADRANLLDDAFNLAKAGYISYKTAFDMIKYLPNEQHLVPWAVASSRLKYLQSILISTPMYIKFRKYIHKILESVITDALWDVSSADSYTERQKKIVVLELSCSMRLPLCVARAKHIFRDWLLKNGAKPEAELRNMIYTTGMANCGEEEWEKVWQLYSLEEEPQEKVKLRNALASVQEPWLLNRLIELAKDENNVRSQDFIILLVSIANNPVGNPIVWNFIRDQWSYLVNRFTLNNRLLGNLIPHVTADFGTKTKLDELKSFLAANSEAGAGAAGRKIALERIENNIQWLASHLPELETIL